MKVKYFKTALYFRKWLEKNHLKKTELIVGFYKVGTKKFNMTWSDSVDEALCFGWIDGIRRGIDEESYCIRFTPRKENSNWSNVNLKKMAVLLKKNLVFPAGVDIYSKRNKDKLGVYSFENNPETLSKDLAQIFKKNKVALNWFQQQAPSYQKGAVHWVMSAKRKETRLKRMEQLILDCENKRKIKPLTYVKK